MKRGILVIIVFLSGCMSLLEPYGWVSPTGDKVQFEKDKSDCEYQAKQNIAVPNPAPPGSAVLSPEEQSRLIYIEDCMKERGYILK